MTANVYGHLSPDYLREEIDRLRFNPMRDSAAGETARRVPPNVPQPRKWPARASGGSAHRAGSVHGFPSDSGRTRTCYPRLRRPVLYPDELRSQGTASTTEVSGLPSVSSSLFTAVSEAVLELSRFSVSRSISPPSQSASR